MGVTASIVVTFGQAADDQALLIAEIDGRPASEGGTNGGRTQFLPGDSAHYLLYKHKVSKTTQRSSAGSLSFVGYGQRQIEDTINFIDTQEGSVQFPVYTLDSYEWLGNDLGTLAAVGDRDLRAAVSGLGVAVVRYTAKYEIWRLDSPAQINGRDSFQIAILITGD